MLIPVTIQHAVFILLIPLNHAAAIARSAATVLRNVATVINIVVVATKKPT